MFEQRGKEETRTAVIFTWLSTTPTPRMLLKILYPLTAFTLRCLLFICIIITDVKLQYATWTYLASGAFENLLCSTLPLTQIRRSHGWRICGLVTPVSAPHTALTTLFSPEDPGTAGCRTRRRRPGLGTTGRPVWPLPHTLSAQPQLQKFLRTWPCLTPLGGAKGCLERVGHVTQVRATSGPSSCKRSPSMNTSAPWPPVSSEASLVLFISPRARSALSGASAASSSTFVGSLGSDIHTPPYRQW